MAVPQRAQRWSISPSPDTFFENPPWSDGEGRGIKGRYRLGLEPIDTALWFPFRITPAEQARKTELILQRGRQVYARADAGHGAERLAAQSVASHLRETDVHDLAAASLLVPDDLCVMQKRNDAFVLVAASLCSPSYWSLLDKLEQPLDVIHANVEGLNDRIGPRMQSFFERLPQGRVFQRRNWFAHNDSEPFHPRYVGEISVPAEDLVIRSERQTLTKLNGDVVLFTIHVIFAPLADIRRHPAAQRSLLEATATWSPAEVRDFGAARLQSVRGYVQELQRCA